MHNSPGEIRSSWFQDKKAIFQI